MRPHPIACALALCLWRASAAQTLALPESSAPLEPAIELRAQAQAQEALEVGSMAALAQACELDAPARITQLISTQFGGSLITSSSATQTSRMLELFAQSARETLEEREGLTPAQRAGQCAFAKARWAPYQSAPALRSRHLGEENLSDLVYIAGYAHGRASRCEPNASQARIGRQSAVIITLASMGAADFKSMLSSAHANWVKAYQEGMEALAPQENPSEPAQGGPARPEAKDKESAPSQRSLPELKQRELSELTCTRASSLLDSVDKVISARPELLFLLLQAPKQRRAKSGVMS